MKSREAPYGTIDIARVLPLKTLWFSIAIDCLLQMGYSYKASKNCMVGGDRRFEKRRCRTFGSCLPSGDWTLQWKGAIKSIMEWISRRGDWRWISEFFSVLAFHDTSFQCSPDWMIIKKIINSPFEPGLSRIAGTTRSEISGDSDPKSAFVWCFNPAIFDVEIPICLMLRYFSLLIYQIFAGKICQLDPIRW